MNMIDPIVPDNEEDAEDLITPDDDNADLSEADPDETVHQKTSIPAEEHLKHDADDAVHSGYKPAADPSHKNQERDPDDMAHGRI